MWSEPKEFRQELVNEISDTLILSNFIRKFYYLIEDLFSFYEMCTMALVFFSVGAVLAVILYEGG